MKEVSDYIWRKFIYRAYIQQYLGNEIKTVVSSPMRSTLDGENRDLSRDQKLVWEKSITEYIKRQTKFDEKYEKSYSLIFIQCTGHMCSKLQANKDYHRIKED